MNDTELIRRVAVEVMGWIDSSEHYYKYENQYQGIRRVWETPHPDCKIIMLGGDFNPTTNLNHAFMVVERLREMGYTGIIHIYKKFFSVKFLQPWIPSVDFTNHGSLGHAICLAALKALEVKHERE